MLKSSFYFRRCWLLPAERQALIRRRRRRKLRDSFSCKKMHILIRYLVAVLQSGYLVHGKKMYKNQWPSLFRQNCHLTKKKEKYKQLYGVQVTKSVTNRKTPISETIFALPRTVASVPNKSPKYADIPENKQTQRKQFSPVFLTHQQTAYGQARFSSSGV